MSKNKRMYQFESIRAVNSSESLKGMVIDAINYPCRLNNPGASMKKKTTEIIMEIILFLCHC